MTGAGAGRAGAVAGAGGVTLGAIPANDLPPHRTAVNRRGSHIQACVLTWTGPHRGAPTGGGIGLDDRPGEGDPLVAGSADPPAWRPQYRSTARPSW